MTPRAQYHVVCVCSKHTRLLQTMIKTIRISVDSLGLAACSSLLIRGHFSCRFSSRGPDYNYGLSGKGKSRSKRSDYGRLSLPSTQGEVLYGIHPITLALRAKRRSLHCIYIEQKLASEGHKDSPVGQVLKLAAQENIPVELVSHKILDALAGNRPHQGVCMDVAKLKVPVWSHREPLTSSSAMPIWMLLHNIQDPMNFGAILRTAHYLGVDKIVVPVANSCKLSPVVSKASAGALEVIKLAYLPGPIPETALCEWWQTQGGDVVGTGVAKGERSVLLENFSVSAPVLLLLGNEGSGLGSDLEDCCNTILTIPGHENTHKDDGVNSLNVSVATGILLHWLKTSAMKDR